MIDTARRRTLGGASSRSGVELPGTRRNGSNGQHGNGTNGAGTFGTTTGRVEFEHVRETILPTDRRSWRVKRAFDILVSGVCLVLLSPVLLAAAIGVRLTSRGPIIFRQPRVGVGGHVFTMYKFRTYPVDHVDDKWSRDHDECPLAFGRFLRRASLDELPQLFNVLRGDMSIVGPRPERLQFARQLTAEVPDYVDRHRVPGGITGAAQVEGLWGPCNVAERVRFDNRYIDDWSLWGDVVILLRTAGAVLRKGVT